jgi:transcriptional regulator with XRE-family HTH domain
MIELGKRIRYFRKVQRRTLSDIAQMCGFTNSLLSKIENGKTTPPVSTLIKIANA